MLVICIAEAAFVQHERRGDIAEVRDLLHAVAREVLVDTARVVVVGIIVVVEALLQSTEDPETGYHSQYLICWVFSRHHSPLVEVLRS